jgi:putative ABC transport system ATP-binding protein
MSDPVIDARRVVRLFGSGSGQVRALRSVSLSLRSGELTLLMGPSGSGKTTLLCILGGLLSPTEGEVTVRGVCLTHAAPSALAKIRRDHIGFVFQSYRLFPTLTALDNVRLALDVRGVPSRAALARSRDVMAKVGLSHKETTFPHELSGGEQQRVAIARAIVGRPSAILADEPTGALDSENGHAVMTLLADIARDLSHAVLVVTHDVRTRAFADRVIHIEDGQIRGEETGEAARERRFPSAVVPLRAQKALTVATFPGPELRKDPAE